MAEQHKRKHKWDVAAPAGPTPPVAPLVVPGSGVASTVLLQAQAVAAAAASRLQVQFASRAGGPFAFVKYTYHA